MNNLVLPVILSGGSGTRLWPLSRKALPKQFAPLIPSKESGAPPRSLLAMTLERASMLSDTVMIVAAEEHRFLVQETVASSPVTALSILEPVGRDTAAAIAVAALNADPDSVLLFMPADHHIPDEMLFASVMKRALRPRGKATS
ncbi:sugar phosphate nucleotidyltransferase [Cupriavidus basilensis]|uniref:sugar phosphate nucleotidyltransferase n=1 Tax=Cupriavidus basilensis TaxID=68895 RepID=UPI003078C07C